MLEHEETMTTLSSEKTSAIRRPSKLRSSLVPRMSRISVGMVLVEGCVRQVEHEKWGKRGWRSETDRVTLWRSNSGTGQSEE